MMHREIKVVTCSISYVDWSFQFSNLGCYINCCMLLHFLWKNPIMTFTLDYRLSLNEHNVYSNKERYMSRKEETKRIWEKNLEERKEDKVESLICFYVRMYLVILPRMTVVPLSKTQILKYLDDIVHSLVSYKWHSDSHIPSHWETPMW